MSSKPDSQGQDSDFSYRQDGPLDRAMLEKVLQETMAAAEVEPLGKPDMNALVAVAKKYVGATLTLEPVAVDLVESILRVRLTDLNAPPEYWRLMSGEIAKVLLEVPSTEQRFQTLWGRLQEAAV